MAKAPAPFKSTGFWLLKSEPESYSIDAFKKDRKTLWTGVRNYQARNFMMTSMQVGDAFLFYHSNADPAGVFGLGKITKVNQPDPTALDSKSDYFDPKASLDHPIWFCCEVSYEAHLAHPLSLSDLKEFSELAKMVLLQKGSRLSVQPVEKAEFNFIVKKAGPKK